MGLLTKLPAIDGFTDLSYLTLVWVSVSLLAVIRFTPQIWNAWNTYNAQAKSEDSKSERYIALSRLIDLQSAWLTAFFCFAASVCASRSWGMGAIVFLTLIPIEKLVQTELTRQSHQIVLDSISKEVSA